MSMTQSIDRVCRNKDGVSFDVRRWELAELAAIVGIALVVQAMARSADGSTIWPMITGAVAFALPLGAAWTLRRSVGVRALVPAGIMAAGMLVALLLPTADAHVNNLTSQGMLAAGMVWVLGSNPRTSTKALILGSTILAVATIVAAQI